MVKLDDAFDFGFSLVDETELKANEQLVAVADHNASKAVEAFATATSAIKKYERLLRMIMPLLNNLKADPEKAYILWPDRVSKIDTFIKKIEAIRNDD